MVKLKNLIQALKEQGPLKRAWRNFIITGNAWGMFSKYSHVNKSGVPKVALATKEKALKVAAKMSIKHDAHFSTYKCIFCDGYHIGKNRNANG